ncbi:hypothetical protein [Veillonella sp.]|uniref:hypothetical protein n=1 Tax=Veillonella sp. TaxID=1926307 RepID=UPI001D365730|nr:hypothetical protein [Veillonella sp.]MBS7042139.1 hypothetical protein [Veillonella sp.]
MYRCIAKLEIDLEGLGEFYSEINEYETLNMYQIISTWLQDDLDGPNPEKRVFGVSEYALDWMFVLPGDISYRNLFDMGSCKLGNRSESIDYLYAQFLQTLESMKRFELEYESLCLDYLKVNPQFMDITLTCCRDIDFLLFIKHWLRNCSTYKHLIYYKVKDAYYVEF